MEINDYRVSDDVEILINNPRNNNSSEWRKAQILYKRMIYSQSNERHAPYPILIVRVSRTYCHVTPIYDFINNIPIFIDNTFDYYEKVNDEGIIYSNQIRLQTNK